MSDEIQLSTSAITEHSNKVFEQMRQATDVAGVCREIVQATAQPIQGKKYVRVEGWQSIAVAYGCVASARDVEKIEGGVRCVGEVRRMDTGIVICTAEGFVGDDEPTWAKRPTYAKRAMCQTRAISRACRSAFAHVVVMIDRNLSTTPYEEVPHDGFDDRPAVRVVESHPEPKVDQDKSEKEYLEALKVERQAEERVVQAKVVEDKNAPMADMAINFGKYKGSTIRTVARTEDGLRYLEWLERQELKLGRDGKPFKSDLERNKIIRTLLANAPEPVEATEGVPF